MKPIVLCADDYAFSTAVSGGILALLAMNRLTATSAMVLSPRWQEDAAPLRDWRGKADIGLHLDWTSPFAMATRHGRSLPRLIGEVLLGSVSKIKVRVAIERQLDLFEMRLKMSPDHVDGHQHIQQFPCFRETLLEVLQRRYAGRLPWLRISREAGKPVTFKGRVITALGANQLSLQAKQAGIPHSNGLSGIYSFQTNAMPYERYMHSWLASVPPGTVLMCHPADPVVAPNCAEDVIAHARAKEFEFLRSDRFGSQLASLAVQMVRGTHLFSNLHHGTQ